MRHHTKSPAQRASDIADREAKRVLRETGDHQLSTKVWLETYQSFLMELNS
jgi:hypothetical protein